MTYLFDASAIYSIIEAGRKEAIKILKGNHTITLAFYEMGNVAWKHTARGTLSREDGLDIMKVIEWLPVLLKVKVLEPKDVVTIFEEAGNLGITYYDASYYFYAKNGGMTLVTDDGKLLKAVSNQIKVIPSNEII